MGTEGKRRPSSDLLLGRSRDRALKFQILVPRGAPSVNLCETSLEGGKKNMIGSRKREREGGRRRRERRRQTRRPRQGQRIAGSRVEKLHHRRRRERAAAFSRKVARDSSISSMSSVAGHGTRVAESNRFINGVPDRARQRRSTEIDRSPAKGRSALPEKDARATRARNPACKRERRGGGRRIVPGLLFLFFSCRCCFFVSFYVNLAAAAAAAADLRGGGARARPCGPP